MAVMGGTVTGRPLGLDPWGSVGTPALVDGSKSAASQRRAADELATRLPHGARRTLQGQSHNVAMKARAPVLEELLSGAGR